MRPKGTVHDLEARRRRAVKLLEEGLSLNEVARRIGCAPSSVMRWRDRRRRCGEAGLMAHSPPGRPPRLSDSQKSELIEELLRDPAGHGGARGAWTTRGIAKLIEGRFGISYHPDHVGRLMHSLGWVYRSPEGRPMPEVAAVEKEGSPESSRSESRPSGWMPT